MRHLVPIPSTSLLRLDPQPVPDLLHTPRPPRIKAPGMQHLILLSPYKSFRARGRLGSNHIDLIG